VNASIDGLAIVQADQVAATPWKNGGGATRELLRLPLPGGGHDDWILRISLADIETDGPFSAFEGVSRWFAVLSGAGVRLDWRSPAHEPRQCTLTPASRPLCFDGGDPPDCSLLGGPTRDLNVMTRDGAARGMLSRAALGATNAAAFHAFGLFTFVPLELRHGGQRMRLPARALAWHAAPASEEWSLAACADMAHTGDAPLNAYWIGVLLEIADRSPTARRTA